MAGAGLSRRVLAAALGVVISMAAAASSHAVDAPAPDQGAAAEGAPASSLTSGMAAAISVVGAAVDGKAFTGARLWDEHISWCDLQPTADADVEANLRAKLGPKLDALVASGATRVMIPLGHAAPWVYGDHPRAWRANSRWSGGKRPIWFCDGRASAVALPSPTALRPAPDGSLSLAQQRFYDYARAVVTFLADGYARKLQVDLQVMNEPNLLNGLDLKTRIPGTARTNSQAVASLRAYERLVARAVGEHPQATFRLVSPSFYQRTNDLLRRYLSAQAKDPTVAALAFNIYSRRSTPSAMISDWDKRAARVQSLVARYAGLAGMPTLVTETNHNLNNHRTNDRSNSRASVTAAAVQARLVVATQMNARYRGFDEVFWLLPAVNQAAVRVDLSDSNPARLALASLAGALGRRVQSGCGAIAGVRRCDYFDPVGRMSPVSVYWRMKSQSPLTIDRDSEVTWLGSTSAVLLTGSRLLVGSSPVAVVALQPTEATYPSPPTPAPTSTATASPTPTSTVPTSTVPTSTVPTSTDAAGTDAAGTHTGGT